MNIHDKSITGTGRDGYRVMDILMETLKSVRGKSVVALSPNSGFSDLSPLFLYDGADIDDGAVIKLSGGLSDYTVVGLDSSIVLVGEACDGFLFGIKGAFVAEVGGEYRIHRFGPFPFYYNDEVVSVISRLDGFTSLRMLWRRYPDLSMAKRLTIIFFEYLLAELASSMYRDSLIVIDGSLSMMRFLGLSILKNLIDMVGGSGGHLIGVAKRTRLVRRFPWLFSAVARAGEPCVVRVPIDGLDNFYEVFIGVFRPGGVPLRVDVASSGGDSVKVLNNIYSAGHTSHGYLEVLKEAHIVSKMSTGEVIALKRFLEDRYDVRFINSFGLRDVIFGAYNCSLGGNGEGI